MEPHEIAAARSVPRSTNHHPIRCARSLPAAPATILLVAIGIGLMAGFLDLGLMLLKKYWTGDGFSRLGEHFPWLIPAGVGAIVMVPGSVLALIAWLSRGGLSLGTTVGVSIIRGLS